METKEQFNQLQAMMEQLVKMVGHNNAVTEELVGRMDKMEVSFDRLETKFDRLEEKVDKLEAKSVHSKHKQKMDLPMSSTWLRSGGRRLTKRRFSC